jgi:thioredoxin reductase (NADPH)
VVGGGNTAVEEALYLSNIASKVHLVHRRDKFRAEAIMVDKVMAKVGGRQDRAAPVTARWTRCWATTSGVTGVRLQSTADGGTAATWRCKGCFIAIGHQPNTDIFKGQLEMKDGYIVTRSGLRRHRHHDQRARRVRRRRRAGPRLPPGDHQRRHRLHGRAGRPALPGADG